MSTDSGCWQLESVLDLEEPCPHKYCLHNIQSTSLSYQDRYTGAFKVSRKVRESLKTWECSWRRRGPFRTILVPHHVFRSSLLIRSSWKKNVKFMKWATHIRHTVSNEVISQADCNLSDLLESARQSPWTPFATTNKLVSQGTLVLLVALIAQHIVRIYKEPKTLGRSDLG